MLNKKMLLSLLVIGVVSVSAGAGTWAYFSDTETSGENTFAAGTLDLTFDTESSLPLAVTNTYPGDSGGDSSTLANAGNLPGELDIAIGAVTNTESTGTTEFEADGAGGELGANAKMVVWLDVDQSGTFNAGDIELSPSAIIAYDASTNTELTYSTIDSYSGVSWDNVETMAAGATDDLCIDWEVPITTVNDIQGDSLSFDVTVTLEQADADA